MMEGFIIEFILSTNIIVLLLIIGLVIWIAYKIFIKKDRPENFYTPFDYITGQSDEEFPKQVEEEENEEKS